jgi:hypothetical protein
MLLNLVGPEHTFFTYLSLEMSSKGRLLVDLIFSKDISSDVKNKRTHTPTGPIPGPPPP